MNCFKALGRMLIEKVSNEPQIGRRALWSFSHKVTGRTSMRSSTGPFSSGNASEIILVKDIELYSLCEHHLLPFIGRAHVAYLPNGKVIGLSKVARIVDVFARRLQIQENLTTQIAESLMNCLQPSGVAVVVEAKHLCMMMRGVEKQNSVMKTSCLLGTFKDDARTRSEFLSLLKD